MPRKEFQNLRQGLCSEHGAEPSLDCPECYAIHFEIDLQEDTELIAKETLQDD